MPTSGSIYGPTPGTLSQAEIERQKAAYRRSRGYTDTSYVTPPAAFDNSIDNQVYGALGAITSGGFTLNFSFAGNYTITVPKTGTALLGTGTAGVIPQLSDANTITDSNLKMTGANVLTLAASGASTFTVPYTGTAQVGKVYALTPSATITMDCALGSTFTLVPDQACSVTPSNATAGTIYNLIITTSGTSSFVITFASPFKVTGTLATGTTSGKVFCVSFVSDGTNVVERSRTTAM